MGKTAITLLLCSLLAQSSLGRKFLQTSVTDCTSLHPECLSCEAQASNTGTVILCLACTNPAYRVTPDSLGCDCSPGYFLSGSENKTCSICGRGAYCSGGTQGRQMCGGLLTTLSSTAPNSSACITLPGVAYMSGPGTATQCPINTYNVGGNQRNCTGCPGELVTSAVGAASMESCQAPPGYFYRNRQALPCAVGSYKPGINMNTVCQACPDGTTTRNTESNSSSNCSVVLPGYEPIFDDAGTAVIGATPCPIGTYSADGQKCTPCTTGLSTETTKSTAASACVAPPGYGFYPEGTPANFPAGLNGSTVIACPIGWYKAGFALDPCSSCGIALLTDMVASISSDSCYIPPGYGSKHEYLSTVSINNSAAPAMPSTLINVTNGLQDPQQLVAAKCGMGSYGTDSKRYGLEPLPCQPCPEYTTTPDAFATTVNTSDVSTMLMTSIHNCSNMAGYGWQHGIAAECPAGFYNPGYNLQPCTVCGVGLTTAKPGGTRETDCIAKPGWQLVDVAQATPCPAGTWSAGGTQSRCTRCPAGSTTTGPAAPSATECSVCLPGWGVATQQENSAGVEAPAMCQACEYGFYNPGGVSTCVACQEGHTSPRRSADSSSCVPMWSSVEPYTSIITNTSTLAHVEAAGAAACQQQCAATMDCQFWIYRTEQREKSDNGCWLKNASTVSSPNTFIAFKLVTGDYTVWPADTEVDSQVGYGVTPVLRSGQSISTAGQCLDACDASSSCLGIWTSYSWNSNWECKLMRGQFRHRESCAIQAVPFRINNAIWAQKEPVVTPQGANVPAPDTPASNADALTSNTSATNTSLDDTGPVAVEPATNTPATQNPATSIPAVSTGTTEPSSNSSGTESPATNAPVNDAAATNTPVAEAPATNAPVNDTAATNTPVAEAPATNAPINDTAATNTPVAEAPATNAPVNDTAAINTPVAEAPATNPLVNDTAATNTPVAEAPATNPLVNDTAATNTPVAEAPATNAPVNDTAATNTPVAEAPAANAPVNGTAATNTPVAEAPATNAPTAEAPTGNTISTAMPATNTPSTEMPAVSAPASEMSDISSSSPANNAASIVKPGLGAPVIVIPPYNTSVPVQPASGNWAAIDTPANATEVAAEPATNTLSTEMPAVSAPASEMSDISSSSPVNDAASTVKPGSGAPVIVIPPYNTSVPVQPAAGNWAAIDTAANATAAAAEPATNTLSTEMPAVSAPASEMSDISSSSPVNDAASTVKPGSGAPVIVVPPYNTSVPVQPAAGNWAAIDTPANATKVAEPATNTPSTEMPAVSAPASEKSDPSSSNPVNDAASTVEPGSGAPIVAIPRDNTSVAVQPTADNPANLVAINSLTNQTAAGAEPSANRAVANVPAANARSLNGTAAGIPGNSIGLVGTAGNETSNNALPANTTASNVASPSPIMPVQEASISAMPDVVAVPVVSHDGPVAPTDNLHDVPTQLLSQGS